MSWMSRQKKKEVMNNSLSRQTFKKTRRIQTENDVNQNQNVFKLKRQIRNVAKMCNDLDHRLTEEDGSCSLDAKERRERNKKFMMAHLSFCQIEEDKIESQKQFLKNIKSLKATTSPSKMVSTMRGTQYGFRRKQDKLVETFRVIDKIYSNLSEMEEIGYNLKTNKYVIIFCTTIRFWLTDIFLN